MDETFAGLDFENYKFIQNKFLDDKELTYIEISHREIDTEKFDYIFTHECSRFSCIPERYLWSTLPLAVLSGRYYF